MTIHSTLPVSTSTTSRQTVADKRKLSPDTSGIPEEQSELSRSEVFSPQSAQWSTSAGYNLYRQVQELYAEEGRGRFEQTPQNVEEARGFGVGRSIDTYA